MTKDQEIEKFNEDFGKLLKEYGPPAAVAMRSAIDERLKRDAVEAYKNSPEFKKLLEAKYQEGRDDGKNDAIEEGWYKPTDLEAYKKELIEKMPKDSDEGWTTYLPADTIIKLIQE